jgi:hypothetical protein
MEDSLHPPCDRFPLRVVGSQGVCVWYIYICIYRNVFRLLTLYGTEAGG